MPILINDHELTDTDIEAELPHHADTDNPLRSATHAVVLRRILLDEARRLGLPDGDADTVIDALLATEVQVPVADEVTCRRYYAQHLQHFTVGELVEAEHILFQVTPQVKLEALRTLAEHTLAEVLAEPDRFAQCARELSNCPSGALGGQLGQLSRGDTVPEFDRVLFAMQPGETLPRVLETRFGLHIVRLRHRVEGVLQPFERVQAGIAEALQRRARDVAWRQYVQWLVGRARISGIDLGGADSPLLQ